ncbi:hypothetical protein KKG22_05805, partial [Patescibacteria group bacterium]|nr:hypothetical protein [Patescibacteria group bacterium]
PQMSNPVSPPAELGVYLEAINQKNFNLRNWFVQNYNYLLIIIILRLEKFITLKNLPKICK